MSLLLAALIFLVAVIALPFSAYFFGKFLTLGVLSAFRSHKRRFPFLYEDCNVENQETERT